MKNIKIIFIFFIMIILTLTTNISNATNENINLKQVKNDICEIKLEEKQSFTKKIISVSDDKKEVTMQLNIENLKSKKEREGEIIFVIDSSGSMTSLVNGTQSRLQVIKDAAKNLSENILSENQNIKIGIVQFSGWNEYKLTDANIVVSPTNVIADVKSAIDSINANGNTNTDAGLQVAKNLFDSDANKTIVLLTDGASNRCVYTGNEAITMTSIINKTKETLQSIIDDEINIVTVLTEVKDNEKVIVDQIFGTQENPYYGEFYYISDSKIEETIMNDVYTHIEEALSDDLENITIKDVFPNDIIENYNIEITKDPTIGTANLSDNTLLWNIKKLKTGETSTLEYKLKLKDNFNKNIIDKETPTNEKVDITYTTDKKESTKTSTVSPSIILKQKTDNTVSTKEIPNAGEKIIISMLIIIISIIGVLLYKIYNKYNDII